ncbi:MAG TPA: hypothetical protein VGL98_14190 [Gammaproteobacteria bacterium]
MPAIGRCLDRFPAQAAAVLAPSGSPARTEQPFIEIAAHRMVDANIGVRGEARDPVVALRAE